MRGVTLRCVFSHNKGEFFGLPPIRVDLPGFPYLVPVPVDKTFSLPVSPFLSLSSKGNIKERTQGKGNKDDWSGFAAARLGDEEKKSFLK